MNEVFHDIQDPCIIFYLDDILIVSEGPEQHTQHIWLVLEWLHQHDLSVKLEKCHFSHDSMEFLGYILSPEGFQMDPKKVEVVQT